MHLSNATPLPAKVLANPETEGEHGIGVVMAKATFRFEESGRVELDSQTPFPLFVEDQPTELGVLPADPIGRRGERFEVMLLGCAHARDGRPVTGMQVALSVGAERRELTVFGDRAWHREPRGGARIGPAAPFTLMPLTYERAFGGSFPVHLDRDTVLDVFDPINKRGRGFDAELWADGVAKMLGVPEGFPVLPGYQRQLPNLENPAALIRHWQDTPEPACWAPVHGDTAVHLLPVVRRETARLALAQARGVDVEQLRVEAGRNVTHEDDPDAALYRAHPDWIVDTPPAGAMVRLEGLVAGAPVVQFSLPMLRVVADYTMYGREGRRDLRPHALVLLPEERAFYVVYRLPFMFEKGPADGRAFRLRTEEGWFQPDQG